MHKEYVSKQFSTIMNRTKVKEDNMYKRTLIRSQKRLLQLNTDKYRKFRAYRALCRLTDVVVFFMLQTDIFCIDFSILHTGAAQYHHEKSEVRFTKQGKEVISTVEKEVDSQMEVYFSNTKSRIKRKMQKARAQMLPAPVVHDLRDVNASVVEDDVFDPK